MKDALSDAIIIFVLVKWAYKLRNGRLKESDLKKRGYMLEVLLSFDDMQRIETVITEN